MQAMESQFDVCTEDLFNQTIKLEEMEKKLEMQKERFLHCGADLFFCRRI